MKEINKNINIDVYAKIRCNFCCEKNYEYFCLCKRCLTYRIKRHEKEILFMINHCQICCHTNRIEIPLSEFGIYY